MFKQFENICYLSFTIESQIHIKEANINGNYFYNIWTIEKNDNTKILLFTNETWIDTQHLGNAFKINYRIFK